MALLCPQSGARAAPHATPRPGPVPHAGGTPSLASDSLACATCTTGGIRTRESDVPSVRILLGTVKGFPVLMFTLSGLANSSTIARWSGTLPDVQNVFRLFLSGIPTQALTRVFRHIPGPATPVVRPRRRPGPGTHPGLQGIFPGAPASGRPRPTAPLAAVPPARSDSPARHPSPGLLNHSPRPYQTHAPPYCAGRLPSARPEPRVFSPGPASAVASGSPSSSLPRSIACLSGPVPSPCGGLAVCSTLISLSRVLWLIPLLVCAPPATSPTSAPSAALPPPDTIGGMSLTETLTRRRSVRQFTDLPLDRTQLSQLCWAAQGLTDPARSRRTAPSAGALYPLELYVVTAAGVDHYLPARHSLEPHASGDVRLALSAAALHQEALRQAPVCFVIAAVTERSAVKYGTRAERYCFMEAGHVAQNILLQATALDLGAVPIGAFDDDRVAAVLKLPPGQRVLYLVPVGHPLP